MTMSIPPGLDALPTELLLMISDYFQFRQCRSMIRVSKRFRQVFLDKFWKTAGPAKHWLPLYIGAGTGDIRLMETAVSYGAPLDNRWPIGRTPLPLGETPLYEALRNGQAEAVEWLVARDILRDPRYATDGFMNPTVMAYKVLFWNYRVMYGPSALSPSELPVAMDMAQRDWAETGPKYRCLRALLVGGARVTWSMIAELSLIPKGPLQTMVWEFTRPMLHDHIRFSGF